MGQGVVGIFVAPSAHSGNHSLKHNGNNFTVVFLVKGAAPKNEAPLFARKPAEENEKGEGKGAPIRNSNGACGTKNEACGMGQGVAGTFVAPSAHSGGKHCLKHNANNFTAVILVRGRPQRMKPLYLLESQLKVQGLAPLL